MHVCGVAGKQDAPFTVSGSLTRHVGEAGDPGGTVYPVIGPVDDGQRFTHVFRLNARHTHAVDDAARAKVRIQRHLPDSLIRVDETQRPVAMGDV